MRNAIALTRVSTDAQAQEDRAGLASQRRECARIAEREGLAIVEWVELAGVSGAKVLSEPRFLALLDRLDRPEISALIVTAQDRLMRPESFDDYAILGRIQRAGVVLYTPSGARDLGRDRLLTMLESEIAHYERVRIRERTMRAKAEHRRRGRHVAGHEALPFGVAFEKSSGAWSYRPSEAQVVRELFAKVLAGARNWSALARELGISRTLVQRILRQPLYAGFRVIEGERQVVLDPPLVSPETWRAAQAIATGRPAPPRGEGPGLYRGFIRCAHCAGPMHVHRERFGVATYRCRATATQRAIQIAQRVVDAEVDGAIAERLADPAVLEAALAAVLEADRAEGPDVSSIEAERKALLEQRERVAIAFERGLRTLTDAERRYREIDAEAARLDRALEAQPDRSIDLSELAAELAEPFEGWDLLGAVDKREILAPAVEWVEVARTGRAAASVTAVRLRIGTSPAPTDPRSAARPAWGGWRSLEVAL